MDVKEFCKRLAGRYNGSNELKAQDIMDWVKRNNVTDEQLNTLELLIVENYGKQSFPYPKDLEDIYKRGYSVSGNNKQVIHSYGEKTDDIYYDQTFVNHVVHKEGLTLSQIIKKYGEYEDDRLKGDDNSCYKNFFIQVFSGMVNNYKIRLNDKNVPKEANQRRTQEDLDSLLDGKEVIREKQPLPTEDEIEEIKKLFNNPMFKKIAKKI